MDNTRDIQNVLGGISITPETTMGASWASSKYTSASPFPKYNNAEITGGDYEEYDPTYEDEEDNDNEE